MALRVHAKVLLAQLLLVLVQKPLPSRGFSVDVTAGAREQNTFLILGGTGRIGTAVASHLLLRAPQSRVILVGRDEDRGRSAVAEVLSLSPKTSDDHVQYQKGDWRNDDELKSVVSSSGCTCLIHTAGPFLDERPTPLRAAIDAKTCRAYVDVSDPLEYLEQSLEMSTDAERAGVTALLSAGAFPGMSNVLGVEAASYCCESDAMDEIQDIRFNYFTAGLGGSGDVNLYITNIGFGEEMAQYDGGKLRLFKSLSGLLLGQVDFFLSDADWPNRSSEGAFGNKDAKERVGTQRAFAWPFPEAATVPRELGASGESSAAMGTSPDIWNDMLGILVMIVPRNFWKSKRFSKFLADFSQPLVKATDFLLKLSSPDNLGETHAMRVDVSSTNGQFVSVVQGHDSFRRCVGQSCAEFALDLLENPSPGVTLPESRYSAKDARKRIIKRLTTTPGTFTYSGPVATRSPSVPSDLNIAMKKAKDAEFLDK